MKEVFVVVEITGSDSHPFRDWETCPSHEDALKCIASIKVDNPFRPQLVFRIEPRYVVEMDRAEAKAKLRELELSRMSRVVAKAEREFRETVKEVLLEKIAKSPQKEQA